MARDSKPKAKLPIKQLSILAIARFAEPLAYMSVFPYLPAMIKSFGVEQNKIAKWAGLTTGVFSVAQSITAVGWGRAADTYGRKPAIIFGLLSTMICFVIWGMSTSLPMAITIRAIQGASNGNVGIIRTMVAEMVTEKELQPRAFSLMPLVWSLGSVAGPSFGGFFAEPAKQFPDVFGKVGLFKKFPFLLPNLIAMFFFLVSATSATLFLKETLPGKRGKSDWGLLVGQRLTRPFKRSRRASCTTRGRRRRSSFVDDEATAPLIPNEPMSNKGEKQTPPKMSEVFTKQTLINLISYAFLALHSVAFDQVLTVFLNYPVVERTPDNFGSPFYFASGHGLSTSEIGTIFTLYGISCGLIQFLVYSTLVTRYGVLNCLRVCGLVLPILYLLTPFTALFPTTGTRLAALLTVMFLKGFAIIVAFPSTTILLTNSCTSLRVLGTLNGFATTFSSVGRALGPASTGAAFTWGVDHGYIIVAFCYLMLIALISAIPNFFIIEGDGPTASVENSDQEDIDDGSSSRSDGILLPNESAIEGEASDEDTEVESSRTSALLGGKKYQDQAYNTMSPQRQ